jgi:hypothetical protein
MFMIWNTIAAVTHRLQGDGWAQVYTCKCKQV